MKLLVVCLLALTTLGAAAPSDVIAGDAVSSSAAVPKEAAPSDAIAGDAVSLSAAVPKEAAPSDAIAGDAVSSSAAVPKEAAPSVVIADDAVSSPSTLSAAAPKEAAPSVVIAGDAVSSPSTLSAAAPKEAAPSVVIAGDAVSSPSTLSAAVPKEAAPSVVIAGDAVSSPSSSSAAVPAAAPPGETPTANLVKSKNEEKSDAPAAESVVEVAEPSQPPGLDIPPAAAAPAPPSPPVKKVPVYVPVEHAAAFRPDNFFNTYPVSSGIGGYPSRSVVYPWYQLVSPEVPILTLLPGSDMDDSSRSSVMMCSEPSPRYIQHGGYPLVYTGPAPAAPYAANQYAANALAGGNPNPYGNRVPYYRISRPASMDDSSRSSVMMFSEPSPRYIQHGGYPLVYTGPAPAAPYAANQYAANALAGGNPNPYGNRVPYYRISHVPTADRSRSSLLSSVSPVSSISPANVLSDSLSLSPLVSKISPQALIRSLKAVGSREYAAEPNRLILV